MFHNLPPLWGVNYDSWFFLLLVTQECLNFLELYSSSSTFYSVIKTSSRNYSKFTTPQHQLTYVTNRPELFAVALHACVTILFAYDRRGWLFTRIVIPRRAVGWRAVSLPLHNCCPSWAFGSANSLINSLPLNVLIICITAVVNEAITQGACYVIDTNILISYILCLF